MKKTGILNRPLSARIAQLGHGHHVAVVDPGTPLPFDDPRVLDLSVTAGIPPFRAVLLALVAEIEVESAVAATEVHAPVTDWFHEAGLAPTRVPHDQLKVQIGNADLIIRTGEQTPYANVVLRCGVPF